MQEICTIKNIGVKVELTYHADDFDEIGTKSQMDFLAGRQCAAAALAVFGLPCEVMPRHREGFPEWPTNFTGSITHTRGYAAALVAPRSQVKSIGIDTEQRHRPIKIAPRLFATGEEKSLSGILPGADLAALAFSAKESFYKCLYPIARVYFGFKQARLVSIDKETFELELLEALPNVDATRFLGHYSFTSEYIHTEIVWGVSDSPKCRP